MSRLDRIIRRRIDLASEPTARSVARHLAAGMKPEDALANGRPPWWPSRFADLVERRRAGAPRIHPPKETRAPVAAPECLPRPEGMTRQAHRRLFREACALAGVDFRAARKETP